MRFPLLLAVLAALPAAAETPSSRANAEAMVAAERAFAAAAHDKGITAAFLESMDQDRAVRLTPEPEKAFEYWSKQKNRTGAPHLVWRPTWAGASRCGDLGFDLGPYSFGGKAWGWFFTIWGRRSPEAPWKWLLDSGVERASDPHVPADTPVAYAAEAAGKWPAYYPEGAAKKYQAEVDEADAALDGAQGRMLKTAYAARLAPDARAVGLYLEDPAIGRAAVLAAVGARGDVAMVRQGGFASACGDLAFTYGSADWTSLGQLTNGNYVRVWRREGPRWTLLFEEVTTPG